MQEHNRPTPASPRRIFSRLDFQKLSSPLSTGLRVVVDKKCDTTGIRRQWPIWYQQGGGTIESF
jgi:hypothetical protein